MSMRASSYGGRCGKAPIGISKLDPSTWFLPLAKARGERELMGQHSIDKRSDANHRRVGGGLLIGALTSGVLAAGALSTAGEADASCVSAGGWFKIGNGCETTKPGDFALAIGPGATATATGGFNTAFSFGQGAVATAVGKFNSASASGDGARAEAVGGYNNTAIAIGDAADGGGSSDPEQLRMAPRGAYASAGSGLKKLADGSEAEQSHGNTAIAVGNSARSSASGVHSFASALGTLANANASGVRNTASAWGIQATARAIGGRNNTAIAIGNPDEDSAGGGGPKERAAARLIPTTAVAGNVRATEAEAREAEQEQSSDNNTAIAIGNGTRAGAGDGSQNFAKALGNRSVAAAIGGDWNRALVFGDDSIASAGRRINLPGVPNNPETYLVAAIEREPKDGNTAIVAGNKSVAVADGLRNLARVFGNRSTALAEGVKKRVTVIGNDVNPPKDDAPK
jgi:hypothetical protein